MLNISLWPYAAVSTSLAAWVVLLAFQQRSNFFSAAVYLSKSNACMLILWNFGIFLAVIAGKLFQKIFFGPLRLIELERLHERVWYTITESLLALTIFRDEFDTIFVIRFVTLLFLKIFHWLAADRVESMEQSPHLSRTFHLRMVTMLSFFWIVDLLFTAFACESILLEGPSVMILFASEYLIMTANNWNTTFKYAANAIDLQSDVPWENKSQLMFYIDLVTDFMKLSIYLAFFSLILTFYGLPINVLRDVYLTARSFLRKCRDLKRWREATKNMGSRYATATEAEMQHLADKTCIICREEMQYEDAKDRAERLRVTAPRTGGWFRRFMPKRTAQDDTPKKLLCGHVFHFHCLRSWLERQQSCPTCRRSVLQPGAPSTAIPAGPQQNAAPRQPPAPQPGQAPAIQPQTAATPMQGRPQPTSTSRLPSASALASSSSNPMPTRNPFLELQLPKDLTSDGPYSVPNGFRKSNLPATEKEQLDFNRMTFAAPELGVPKSLQQATTPNTSSSRSTLQATPATPAHPLATSANLGGEGTGDLNDPIDRVAAMRRQRELLFGRGSDASPSRSRPQTPLLGSSLPPSPQIGSINLGTSTAPSTSASDKPQLIPLFRGRNGNSFDHSITDLLNSATQATPPVSIPNELTEEQLQTMSRDTREGIEARLALLQSVQRNMQSCMSDLQRALQAMTDDKGKGAAEGINV